MSMNYFWDGEQVIYEPKAVFDEAAAPYIGMYCVDLYSKGPMTRYGMFLEDDGPAGICVCWKHIPISEFPPQFRAHLMLLGIP